MVYNLPMYNPLFGVQLTHKQISAYIIISQATCFFSHATRFSSREKSIPRDGKVIPRDGNPVPREGCPVPHGTVNFPEIGTVYPRPSYQVTRKYNTLQDPSPFYIIILDKIICEYL